MTLSAAALRSKLDTAALFDYTNDVKRSLRARDPAASPDDEPVAAEQVRWRRIAAMHVHQRLPQGSYAEAASFGLQDSAPRSGQLALHARVKATPPDAWEHPSLAQIWFRWADYIVPRADLAVFTRGVLPQDERQAAALEALADVVLQTITEEEGDSTAVRRRLSDLPLRSACVTGRILIRWDARTIEVLPNEDLPDGSDAPRLELARRFLHFYGPAGPASLAKFSAMTRAASEAAFAALEPELETVSIGGRRRWLLKTDLTRLRAASPPHGVRLLPLGDPLLYMGDTEEPPPRRSPDPDQKITQHLLNSLSGRLLVDGDVVGAWGRVRGDITIDPWQGLQGRRDEIEAEAATVAGAVGHQPRIHWLKLWS